MVRPEHVEEAVKAIAIHVRNELKETSKRAEDIDEKIEKRSNELKETIKRLEDKIDTAKEKVAVPADINDKFDELESQISEFDEKIKQVGIAKIAELEKKISSIPKAAAAPDIEKRIDEKVNARIDELNKKLSSVTVQKAAGLSPTELENIRSQIEAMKTSKDDRLTTIETTLNNRLQRLEEDLKRSLAPEEQRITEYSKKMEALRSQFENTAKGMEQSMEQRIASLQLQQASREDISKELGDIRSQIESLKATKDERAAAVEDMLRNEVQRLEEDLKRTIAPEEQKIMEYSKKMDLLRSQFESISKNTEKRFESMKNDLQATVHGLGDINKNIEAKVAQANAEFDKRLGVVNAEFEKKVGQVSEEMGKKFQTIAPSLEKRIVEKLEAYEPKEDVEKRLRHLEEEITDMQKTGMQKIEEDTIAVNSLNKKVQDMELFTRDVEAQIEHAENLEKRLNSLEEELKSVQRTEKELEEESVIIASIDKKMQDMDLLTKDIEAKMEYVEKLEKQLEKSLDAKATKIFTKQLEDFSRIMDRRLPSLVTREDLYKNISEIKSRLDTIEAPDLTPLAQKVDYLEKRTEAIYDMLKSVSSRIPIIVE